MNSSKKKKRILAILLLLLLLMILLLLYFPFGSSLYVGLNENKVLVPTVQFNSRSGYKHNSNLPTNLTAPIFVNVRKQTVRMGAVQSTDMFKPSSALQQSFITSQTFASHGSTGGTGFNNSGANNAMAMFGMMPIFNPNFNNPSANNEEEVQAFSLMDSGYDPFNSSPIPIGNSMFVLIFMGCIYCFCIYRSDRCDKV